MKSTSNPALVVLGQRLRGVALGEHQLVGVTVILHPRNPLQPLRRTSALLIASSQTNGGREKRSRQKKVTIYVCNLQYLSLFRTPHSDGMIRLVLHHEVYFAEKPLPKVYSRSPGPQFLHCIFVILLIFQFLPLLSRIIQSKVINNIMYILLPGTR